MRALVGPWILGTVVIVFGCIESNPDFDEPSAAGSTTDAGSSSASDASATPTTEAAATDDMTLETDTSSATSGTETADPTTETETTDPTTTTETTDPTTTTETTAAPCEPPCAPELEQCLDGVCACADGLERCDGACVDPGGDWQHCGGCGLVCRGQCVQGMCAKCPGNQVGCAGECVNTGNNDEHCGGCDIACLPGQNCIQGQCAG